MHTIILADAALELVPAEIAGHPAIRKQAKGLGKQPSHLLLDTNLHHAAMKGLDDATGRGRPDIVHYTLLSLLESPLNKAGDLQVVIHTRDGTCIRIRPDTRLPRGEVRFQGVMTKVLLEGRSQDKDPLIWSEGRLSAADVLERFASGPVIRLDQAGATQDVDGIPSDATVVIGGFAHGTFSDAWQAASPDTISLWPEELAAWAVAAEVVAHWRRQKAPSPSGSTPPS